MISVDIQMVELHFFKLVQPVIFFSGKSLADKER